MKKNAEKDFIVEQINNVMNECEDLELLQLIYILLLKSL